MVFAKWLIERLEARDWKQADLVKASGLSSTTISRYITGEKVPNRIDVIERLATALGATPADIAQAKKDQGPLSDERLVDQTLARLRPFVTSPELAELVVMLTETVQRWNLRMAMQNTQFPRAGTYGFHIIVDGTHFKDVQIHLMDQQDLQSRMSPPESPA